MHISVYSVSQKYHKNDFVRENEMITVEWVDQHPRREKS